MRGVFCILWARFDVFVRIYNNKEEKIKYTFLIKHFTTIKKCSTIEEKTKGRRFSNVKKSKR